MLIDLKSFIRDVPDFPKPGILFKDISPMLLNPKALAAGTEMMRVRWEGRVDIVAALDARGFIFGALLASAMGLPLVMVRKRGKLPGNVIGMAYDLEYGSAEIEMQSEVLCPGVRVLIVDDLLATGGTAFAACQLIEKAGAKIVGCAFAVELAALGGRRVLGGHEIQSLVSYGEEEQ